MRFSPKGGMALAVVLVVSATGTWAADGVLSLEGGIELPYPAGWSPAPRIARNAVELLNVSPGETAVGAAKIIVSLEDRSDHADALRRLVQIAAESAADPGYREICGWPGLQRRYEVPVLLPGEQAFDLREGRSAVQVTTAVAVNDALVRLQSVLGPDTEPGVVEEIEAIGLGLICDERAEEGQVRRELERLRRSETQRPSSPRPMQNRRSSAPPNQTTTASAAPAASGAPAEIQTGFGEIEIAVSTDGQHVVMAANSGYTTSNDGGANFGPANQNPTGTPPPPFALNGDPSVAYGVSGNFYLALIGFPMARNGPQCSTAISSSTDNGQTFNFVTNAFLCDDNNGPFCFTDQEHIAADRFNAAPGGGDQVYSTWRNFGGGCNNLTTEVPTLICSTDSGQTWPTLVLVNGGTGVYPRITVGQDGFVYVVYQVVDMMGIRMVMLDKYSSCANGLVLQPNFPATVTALNAVVCPVAGLDRCNSGNRLESHMVAVDDTNPNHVYVAYSSDLTGNANDDNVMVIDSTDGGVNWGTPVSVNTAVSGVRFMPWVCSEGGAARVAWYDRRAGNDLTDYFCGSASPGGGMLNAGTELNLTNNPDPHCNSGWPCAPRNVNDSEACPTQPQQAGRCQLPMPPPSPTPNPSTNNQCDFSDCGVCANGFCVGTATVCTSDAGCARLGCACPANENCTLGRGCPKYGDYNGNACEAGRIYTAWSSATAPMGLPAPGGLSIFFDSKLADPAAGVDLTIDKTDQPDPVVAGTNLTYTVTVQNNGPATALNVAWTDELPGTTATIGFIGASAPMGWSCGGVLPNNSGTLTCTNPFMAIGEEAVFDIEILVRANVLDGTFLDNDFEVSSDDPDPTGPNSGTIFTEVIAVADLETMKNATPDLVFGGNPLMFEIEIVNNGPSDAQNVVFEEAVPANTKFLVIEPPVGWACMTPPPLGTGMITCTIATLPAGESAAFLVRVVVNGNVADGTIITNSVAISSDTTDPNPDDNSSTTETEATFLVPTLGLLGLFGALLVLVGVARSSRLWAEG